MKSRSFAGKIGVICLLCLWSQVLKCQDIESPRFFKFNIQSFSPTNQLISQQGHIVSPQDDEPGYLLSSQLLFPIKLKGKTKLIGELDYGRESVYGLHNSNTEQDQFLHFSKLGLTIIAQHKFSEKVSYMAAFKAKAGSQEMFAIDNQSLSYNATHLLQNKINKKTTVGLGFQLGYNQRFAILPIVKYEKEFGNNWKADILLPSQALFYKKINDTKRLFFGIKGSRASYHINQAEILNSTDIYFRRITANVIAGYEKQLAGPLGVRIEAGADIPIQSGLYRLDKTWQQVHDYQRSITPYIKAGVYLAIDK